ncbi:hypothetical protein HDV00_000513 [Rhizophlyctis rosea]|nr:hypothetical protein HDV00_000513 [Rhizophlyctis rosea]
MSSPTKASPEPEAEVNRSHGQAAEGLTEYEAARRKNIERNAALLRSLGLGGSGVGVGVFEEVTGSGGKENSGEEGGKGKSGNISTSESLARIDALESAHSSASHLFDDITPKEEDTPAPASSAPAIRLSTNISFPLSLMSIRTTIWEIGTLVTDPGRCEKFWSHKSAMYKHPYPVGFRASKVHFDREWTMKIEHGGDVGPVFSVTGSNGTTYSGSTPTKPWTDVCIALAGRHGKTRISGPLFFGFSDLLMQRMVEGLDGFEEVSRMRTEAEEKEREAARLRKEEWKKRKREEMEGKEEGGGADVLEGKDGESEY